MLDIVDWPKAILVVFLKFTACERKGKLDKMSLQVVERKR